MDGYCLEVERCARGKKNRVSSLGESGAVRGKGSCESKGLGCRPWGRDMMEDQCWEM